MAKKVVRKRGQSSKKNEVRKRTLANGEKSGKKNKVRKRKGGERSERKK